MKVIAVGQWSNTKIGNVDDGDLLDLDEGLAQHMLDRGYVRRYEVKPEPVIPLAPGQAPDAGLSPADRPARKTFRRSKAKGPSSQ